MASPSTPPSAFGEHEIEAVQRLLVHMKPESIKDYAKALDALGKKELAYRLKAIKECSQDRLEIVIHAAQMRDTNQTTLPARSQAQPTEARSLKRPRPNTNASETTNLKPGWQLALPYIVTWCSRSNNCREVWVESSYFFNHFRKHLLSTASKAKDGSMEWVCDPDTCGETFADFDVFMEHIWKEHMRAVSRQRPGPSQTPVGASGYSTATYLVPHAPGDDAAFSPHHTTFPPLPSTLPTAVTPNATVSHTAPFTAPAPTQLSVGAQSSMPFGTQPVAAFSNNGYPRAMHGNNTTNPNILYNMPHGHVPYGLNPHTTIPNNNNVTHNDISQNWGRGFAHENMTDWPDQSLSVPLSPSTAAGQPHPAQFNPDFNNFNPDPRFG